MKCKLLNKDLTTHGGFKWEIGKTYTIEKPGDQLCTDQVFHGYHSPETAALFNRIHANIQKPVCYEIKCGAVVSDDELKFGSKSMRLVKQVELPKFTTRQQVIFSVLCAFEVSFLLSKRIDKWDEWVESFLSNDAAAYAAAYAAYAADAYAADADAYAADTDAAANAAAYAADAAYAAYAAANAAADAAVYAANAAVYAAYAAAYDAANINVDFTDLAKKALSWDRDK